MAIIKFTISAVLWIYFYGAPFFAVSGRIYSEIISFSGPAIANNSSPLSLIDHFSRNQCAGIKGNELGFTSAEH